MPQTCLDPAWNTLDDLVSELALSGLKVGAELQPSLTEIAVPGIVVLYDPQAKEARIAAHRSTEPWALDLVKQACQELLGDLEVSHIPFWRYGTRPWVKVAGTRSLGEALNFFPGTYPGGIPNHPSPVGAMIAGGLVGAATGYGAGWLGEKLLPGDWQKGRLRKTLAGLGAGVGMAPSLAWAYANHANGKGLTDSWPLNTPPASSMYTEVHDKLGMELAPAYSAAIEKYGAFADQSRGGAGDPSLAIDVNEFNKAVWLDGRVRNFLNPEIAGAATGVLAAAEGMPGGVGSGWVTPGQLGRLAAGMGVGYVSGAIVGSALGALTGMPAPVQNRLKQTGMYAGLVSSLVPRLFGH